MAEDGREISEDQCQWPKLDPSLHVDTLVYQTRRGGRCRLHAFEAYGFQRYALSVPGGPHHPAAGAQIIGVFGDRAVIVDVNELTGHVERHEVPRAELTYRPELLRNGVGG